MDDMVVIGCWISTPHWGEAVVTGIEGDWVQVRYPAVRGIDGKEIWVANGEPVDRISFSRPRDAKAEHVLTMSGPYGL